MATQYHTLEVWVLVNQDGEYVAHDDPDSLNEAYEERVGDLSAADGLRRVKLTVRVPLPAVIEIAGEVAVSEEPGELKAV